ncbi:hypothetical protein [Amycolatopsis sp. NPDC051371]|uniref:hypothetical protein n=1 Tax=Amycolatopsis sp. NPDC051371 TaxID=3155800 RepID=UPI00341918F6
MSQPESPAPQPSPPQPQATTTKPRAGTGLLSTAILLAGIGGGLPAWHPWDKPAPEPAKDPQHITVQQIGDQDDPTDSASSRPVYCMTNETGGLYSMVMPGRYTGIRERQ